ncbi:MAG: DnaJ domain-containing protein, partial [Chitinophagaceae bacterium]
MPVKDYYKILEVAHNASELEIKKAYRQMAMRFHPDKNEGNELAENHFKEVLEAYEILSDPQRRSAYNQQRWYRQSNRKQADDAPITSYSILHKSRA